MGADPSVVNVPWGSRKDVRDAIIVARAAHEGWAKRTAYNRGQILYRLAEVMESRRDELIAAVGRAAHSQVFDGTRGAGAGRGAKPVDAAALVTEAIDKTVYFAGFTDKYQSLVSSSNPVAGPHFGFSVPEAMGVVALLSPPTLLGLVSAALPAIVGGNSIIAVVADEDPRPALVFAECLATSDMPGGVWNILTGRAAELGTALVRHRDVDAFSAYSDDEKLARAFELDGAASIKRVSTFPAYKPQHWFREDAVALSAIERFLETKTVWHPVGI